MQRVSMREERRRKRSRFSMKIIRPMVWRPRDVGLVVCAEAEDGEYGLADPEIYAVFLQLRAQGHLYSLLRGTMRM